MKKIQTILTAAVLMLGTACNKQEGAPASRIPSNSSPIRFGTYVKQTRAQDITTENIHDFGVFAYHTGAETWNSATPPNFMYNQQVSGSSGNGFSYAPVKYWPSAEGAKISFFAYAPYGSSTNGLIVQTGPSDSGSPKVKYAVPSDEQHEIDLLAASPLYDATRAVTEGKIRFQFTHMLSRIVLHATLSGGDLDANTKIYLNEVTLTGKFPTSGVLDLGERTWSEVVSGRDKQVVRTFGNGSDGLLLGTGRQEITSENGSIMLIPSNNLPLELKVRYSIVTEDASLSGGSLVMENTCTKPLTGSFREGMTYNYILLVGPQAISFDEPVVTEWSASTDTDIEL